MSSIDFAGGSAFPAWIASENLFACEKKPSLGLSENTFCQLAVSVTAASHASGTAVTHAHFSLPCLISSVVQTVSATAASSWLAMAPEKICDMPLASVGASPVRATSVCSCTELAALCSAPGLIEKPSPLTAVDADCTVLPTTAAGAFIA